MILRGVWSDKFVSQKRFLCNFAYVYISYTEKLLVLWLVLETCLTIIGKFWYSVFTYLFITLIEVHFRVNRVNDHLSIDCHTRTADLKTEFRLKRILYVQEITWILLSDFNFQPTKCSNKMFVWTSDGLRWFEWKPFF